MDWLKNYKNKYPGCTKYNDYGMHNKPIMNGGCECKDCTMTLNSWVESLNKEGGL